MSIDTEFFRRALPWSRLMLKQKILLNDLNVSVIERFRALIAIVLLCSVIASAFNLLSWWMPLGLLFGAGMANFRLMNFFYQRKGLLFSFNSLLYQQFYYLYSSTAFLCALLEKVLSGNKI
jgi:hypothetical protein